MFLFLACPTFRWTRRVVVVSSFCSPLFSLSLYVVNYQSSCVLFWSVKMLIFFMALSLFRYCFREPYSDVLTEHNRINLIQLLLTMRTAPFHGDTLLHVLYSKKRVLSFYFEPPRTSSLTCGSKSHTCQPVIFCPKITPELHRNKENLTVIVHSRPGWGAM